MQLLSKLEAAPAFSEHRYDASHVALSTLEALDDVWMRLMDMCGCHVSRISYGGGYAKRISAVWLQTVGIWHFSATYQGGDPVPQDTTAAHAFSRRPGNLLEAPQCRGSRTRNWSPEGHDLQASSSAARNSPTARASAATVGLRHAERFGRTHCVRIC
jgi:hypothetical protein